MKIDVRGLKKIKSDKKSSTFLTAKGHQFIVAHNALNKTNLKELDNIPVAYKEDSQKTDFSNVNNMPKMANGGKVARYAEGTTDAPVSNADAQPWYKKAYDYVDNALSLPDEKSQSKTNSAATAVEKSAGQSVPLWQSPAESVPDRPDGFTRQGPLISAKDQAAMDAIKSQEGPVSGDDNTASQGYSVPSQGRGPADNSSMDMSGPIQAQINAINEQKAGQQQMAQAQGAGAQAMAGQEQRYQDQAKTAMDAYNSENARLTQERNGIQNDIATAKINPDQYIQNMSTGSRIVSAIGLIMGGIGSGVTHGPNLAFQALQSNIDRDIDAQKMEIGKKQNLLSNNLAQTNNLRSAMDMTRLQQNDLLSSHLKQQAFNTQNASVKGNLLNIAGQFDQQSGQLQQKLAIQRALIHSAGGQGTEQQFQGEMQFLRMNGQEKIAEDIEKKHLPGVPGQASGELTTDDKKEWKHLQNLEKSYNDAQSFLSNTSKFGPGFANANKSRAIAIQNSLELEVGQLEDLKRFTPEEAKRYNGMIPNLSGTHLTGQDQAKLSQLMRELSNHKQTFLESAGFRTSGQSAPSAGQQYKTVNGVQYMRGPDGKAIRVK